MKQKAKTALTSLIDIALKSLGVHQKQFVPIDLLETINSCRTEEELTALLIRSKGLDEQMIQAFDQRFRELEQLE